MYSASIVYHFYISNYSAHADNNCNKCELTARSIVGIAKYRHVVTLKRVGAFSLCFWIASSAFTLMMFKNFAILKMYGYALISPPRSVVTGKLSSVFDIIKLQYKTMFTKNSQIENLHRICNMYILLELVNVISRAV